MIYVCAAISTHILISTLYFFLSPEKEHSINDKSESKKKMGQVSLYKLPAQCACEFQCETTRLAVQVSELTCRLSDWNHLEHASPFQFSWLPASVAASKFLRKQLKGLTQKVISCSYEISTEDSGIEVVVGFWYLNMQIKYGFKIIRKLGLMSACCVFFYLGSDYMYIVCVHFHICTLLSNHT